jgi:hypothetical protein
MTGPTVPTEAVESDARVHLAWLMYCWKEGYTNAEDRAVLPNWLLEPDELLHRDDVALRPHLLAMADEVLAAAAPVLQAQERERLKRVIEAKRDAFGPTQALAWSQGMSAAAFICSLAVPEEPGDLQPNRCRLTPGPHDPHEWPGAVTGKPYWCDGRNNPVINRGAN